MSGFTPEFAPIYQSFIGFDDTEVIDTAVTLDAAVPVLGSEVSAMQDRWLSQLGAGCPLPVRGRRRRGRRFESALPTAAQIAAEMVRQLGPATRAEFITAGNAHAVTGQSWRWVVAEGRRLGVPIGGSGKKRVVDLAVFRAALAAEARPSIVKCVDDPDPAEQIRRMLGSARANGASRGH